MVIQLIVALFVFSFGVEVFICIVLFLLIFFFFSSFRERGICEGDVNLHGLPFTCFVELDLYSFQLHFVKFENKLY